MLDRTAAALAAAAFFTAHAAAAQHPEDAGCDPRVRDALVASAAAGVERDFAAIRDPEQGIRDPEPLAAFSCLERALDYGRHDIHYDPGGVLERLLRTAQRQVCNVARDAWRRAVGRGFDPGVFTGSRRRLPGLGAERPAVSPAVSPPAVPAPERIGGAGAAERFRGIVGGGR